LWTLRISLVVFELLYAAAFARGLGGVNAPVRPVEVEACRAAEEARPALASHLEVRAEAVGEPPYKPAASRPRRESDCP
jgi:hypothetical protein